MDNNFFHNLYDQQLANIMDENEEVFTIDTNMDENSINPDNLPKILKILPLRNTVMFPSVLIPIHISRKKSIELLKHVFTDNKMLGTCSQKDANIDDPVFKDIFPIGTLANTLKVVELPDFTHSVIIQGVKRFRIIEVEQEEPYIIAKVEYLADELPDADDKEFEAMVSSLKDLSVKIIQLSNNIPSEVAIPLKNITNAPFLINFISSNTDLKIEEKQKMLEENNLKKRAIILLQYLSTEVQKLELKDDIQTKVKTELDKQQREYFLNQQIKTIQNELGGDPIELEITELQAKAKNKKWSKEVSDAFQKEIGKFKRINPMSPDYSYQSAYLNTLVDLPWNEFTKDSFDMKRAQTVLDKEHFGLEQVKERILEHLAVLKLKKDMKSPIICLYGPPGVGKTSLGKSIAKALNRKYARISLGGLHDEAEIRGHRKTYIGAMPGRIIQTIKKVNSSNPVFVLDEIDKIGNDFRGDPAAALLEVLDPEQNNTFHDNYLDLDFDLSKVLFVATANSLSSIKPALLDRMELIDVTGYIVEEKIQIAKKHLIPKLLADHGIKKNQISLTEKALEQIIVNYTQESGVRDLNKLIAKIVRNYAKRIAFGEKIYKEVDFEQIRAILKAPKYLRQKYQGNEYAGVVTGLAWTPTGGQILFIEASVSKGQGRLTLTGNLGNVMKESATIALEYVKVHSEKIGINTWMFDRWNIHIHVPEGAIPKDGPSAGITMATAIASALTQRKVKPHMAMTGEITLRGKVLPVGGIKEKILAAKRADIHDIILSIENKKDIEEIKETYIQELNFHYVTNIIDVLSIALLDEQVENAIKFVKPERKAK